MINKILKNKKFNENTSNLGFLILVFALLSLLSGIILLHYNFVGSGADLHFHWQRIWELRQSFQKGHFFPNFALNEFNQSGSAVMSMYPYINLFPIVILSFFIHSFVQLVYIVFILRNFLSLTLAFFSCYSFNKNKKISFIFSVSYTLSTMVLMHAFQGMDLGISSSLIFFPLILFGFFNLLNNNKWYQLSFGISLIIFCHVLNSIIAFLFIITLVVVNLKALDKKHYVSLLKAFLISLLFTSVFWVPFIYIYLNNKISTPPFYYYLTGTDLNSLTAAIFGNQISACITIAAAVGGILSVINYKKLSVYSKQIFWIGIFFLFLCSDFFPWNLINETFVRTFLQFPWRLFVIPQLLFCYLFAELAINLCSNNNTAKIVLFLITLFIMNSQFIGQKEIIDAGINNTELVKTYGSANVGKSYKISSNNSFSHVIRNGYTLDTDYFPKESLAVSNLLINHKALYDIDKKSNVLFEGNGEFEFALNKNVNELNIPFICYNGINYKAKLDGKRVPLHTNSTKMLTINNVNKGKHSLQVIVQTGWYNIISYVLSILGLLIYLYLLIRFWLVN